MVATLFLAAMAALAALPHPFDMLDLSESQATRLEKLIQARYEAERQLRERVTKQRGQQKVIPEEKFQRQIQTLRKRFDDQIDKLLTEPQRIKLAEFLQLMEEGIPLGQGMYCSYFITPRGRFYRGPGPPTGAGVPTGPVYRETEIEFEIINRSGRKLERGEFVAEGFDRDGGKRIERIEFVVEELDDGASHRVILDTEHGVGSHWKIRWAQDLPGDAPEEAEEPAARDKET